MNETLGAKFGPLITARLQQLEAEDMLGQAGQATVELDQQSVGRLSRMDALQNQAMAKANQTRRHTERARLLAAFARVQDGEFGYCQDCGEDIARRRLELDPAATKCIGCAKG